MPSHGDIGPEAELLVHAWCRRTHLPRQEVYPVANEPSATATSRLTRPRLA